MPILVAAEADAGTPGLRRSDRANKGHPCDHLNPGAPVACLWDGQRRGRNTRGPQVSSGAKGLPKGYTRPTASGRPETAAEFVRQVKDHFVLRSPCERTVGGEVDTFTRIDESTSNPESHNASDQPSVDTETQIPLTFLDNDNLLGKIKNNYGKDSFFKLILDDSDASHYRNFEECDGYIQLRSKERTALCIPNVMVDGRSVREWLIEQAHSLLAHPGTSKTLAYLRDHLWWKDMAMDIHKYCESCTTRKRSKPLNQKPYGLLHPLQVPTKPWESISIDFVGPLPVSKDRNGKYNSITVIIDLLTGMVHLIPSRMDSTVRDVAELVFSEVYKHHGLPRKIVSDRDTLFTSTFWTHLKRLIGIEQRLSSAYHPQTDSATEHANCTIGQMLRSCIGPQQWDWVSRLPGIEFAINSSQSKTTGYAPFFLNSGRLSRAFIWNNPSKDEYLSVRVFTQRMKHAVMEVHDAILEARVKQTRHANKKHQPTPFKLGDLTYVSTKNMSLPKGQAQKLTPRYISPYKIVEDFRNNSYKLDLPARLRQRGIHPVFHSSLMKIHVPNNDRLFPGRMETQVADFDEPDTEWQVDRILSYSSSGNSSVFEIWWTLGDVTWLPLDRPD